MRQDLASLAWLAPRMIGRIPVAALANPPALVELFAETIVEELDFRLEAENMLDIAAVMAHTGVRNTVVPRPHPRLVTRRVLVMERLFGFNFDDVEGMKAAGIDTGALLRSSLIGFLEGALLHGVFHGDLHGGNLFVMPDGRTALLDFGITGRLDEVKRLAFLRLLVFGTNGDVLSQLAAFRDLGAFPPDTDLEAVVVDLGLDGQLPDPTEMTGGRADERAARAHEEAARVRRPRAEGAHALREEHDVPRRCDRDPGARPRHPRRDGPDLRATSSSTTASRSRCSSGSIRRSASTSTSTRSRPASGSGPSTATASPTREVKERREIIRKRMQDHGRKR